MKEYVIFTDGDVDLPSPYEKEVSLLPQYYYFDENMIYGDEQVLSREAFFEQLRSRRAYTAGVNPDFTRRRFEEVLGAGKDVLCIAVSSALSGSYSTICMVADELRPLYPESRIEVIDSLSATLGSGFLCVDAIEMRGRGVPLAETAEEIRRRVDLPVIGIVKRDYPDSKVFITPTMKEIEELVEVGTEIIALDATCRLRPGNKTLDEFYRVSF